MSGMGAAAGMVLDLANNELDYQRAKSMKKKDIGYQKEMADYYYDLGIKKFKETGYEAQAQQLRDAGMNIGLMYGSAGQGGQSTTPTSPTQEIPFQPKRQGIMDIAALENAQANTKVAESQADLNNANADAIRGYKKEESTAQTTNLKEIFNNLKADTKNKETENEIKKVERDTKLLDYEFKHETYDWNVEKVDFEIQSMREQYDALVRNNSISEETKEAVINTVKQNYINSVVETAAKKANINLTNESARSISEKIAQGWEELSLKHASVSNEKARILIDAELRKSGLNIQQQKVIMDGIFGILNGGNTTETLSGETPAGDRRTVTKKKF